MARLSKHGTELLRIEAEHNITDSERSTDWERRTRAYMSDGKVMQKVDVHFKPTTYQAKGERYSYGWKLYANRKAGTTIEHYQGYVSKLGAAMANGLTIGGKPTAWKVVTGESRPIVIVSQARIMRAIESGESVGFCKSCGAEADGVEPDARNYKCGECGDMAVYGAEEMLIAG
jgi:hypothetical protein